jgi:hypothetical protein
VDEVDATEEELVVETDAEELLVVLVPGELEVVGSDEVTELDV